MRIIAGRFRRRKLLANPGSTTRPIPDRAKEILFERLDGDVAGKRIADVFAGTGTMGLEALSRGAAGVVFIEKDRRAAELLRKNVHSLEVESESLCWETDVFRCSFRPHGVPHLVPFDTVIFDPPYRMMENLKRGSVLYRSLRRLLRPGVTAESALLVLRTPDRAEFDLPEGWQFDRTLDLKSMHVHLYDKNCETTEESTQDSPSNDDASDDIP